MPEPCRAADSASISRRGGRDNSIRALTIRGFVEERHTLKLKRVKTQCSADQPLLLVVHSGKKAEKGIRSSNSLFAALDTVLERYPVIGLGQADAIAFGQHFIANPYLPHRLKVGAPLNPASRTTFYGDGAAGYLDYPALDAVE